MTPQQDIFDPPREPAQLAREAERLLHPILPLFADRGPDLQGAALMQLLATWLAGHQPDLRDDVLKLHVKAVREIIPVTERKLFATRLWPKELPPA